MNFIMNISETKWFQNYSKFWMTKNETALVKQRVRIKIYFVFWLHKGSKINLSYNGNLWNKLKTKIEHNLGHDYVKDGLNEVYNSWLSTVRYEQSQIR